MPVSGFRFILSNPASTFNARMHFIKTYLMTIVGLLGALFFFATMSFGISRDASGIDGLLFRASRLAGMVVIFPSQMLILFNDGELVLDHRTLPIGIGLGGCLVLDLIKNKLFDLTSSA